MTSRSEAARQWVHIGSAAFAFLLRFMAWWEAALLAATALVFNLLVLPRIGGRLLYRTIDEARGFPVGILLYPLSVLLLIVVFPARPDIVAAAWGILAFGDGAATLVGQRVRGRAWPWNPDKTMAGTAAFVVAAAFGATVLALWTRPAVVEPQSVWFATLGSLAAAVFAALAETLPVRLDDNITVPATAGMVLWLASLVSGSAIQSSWPAILEALPSAIGINTVAAWLGYRARTVSASGAVAGWAIGFIIYGAGGRDAWFILIATFALASATSRLGVTRKTLLGIAEERGGRRGAGNAIANCGVAAAAAVMIAATPYVADARLALVAALAAGGSDTVASEIGKAWGRSTFLVTSLDKVTPGTPGAMSLEGTAAGLLAAFGLASLASALGQIGSGAIVAVVVGATVGAFVESLLGATVERPGFLNNDMLNFLNTAVAAAVALRLA